MAGGFRYIMGAVAGILLVFVVWSLWPQFTPSRPTPAGSLSSRGAAQPAPSYPPTYSPPVARAYPPSASARAATASQPSITNAVARLQTDLEAEPATFALRQDVILLKEPDGAPHRPSCISHAPLTILRGTTITRIDVEGDWAMVTSPSSTSGWIPLSELLPITDLPVGL